MHVVAEITNFSPRRRFVAGRTKSVTLDERLSLVVVAPGDHPLTRRNLPSGVVAVTRQRSGLR
ncbi:hypothetical protein NITHO_2790007 [Nitrolancea hollandica Lb]|uniref:Uncharacterized protein n=1 Tax=Nitrolancea hollandica Lb TaxID=1129897 RepID=I4EGN1_9BACT|nr:hypothetical protein NITHO_2790007 [Nitrolancea hollandica Lb]